MGHFISKTRRTYFKFFLFPISNETLWKDMNSTFPDIMSIISDEKSFSIVAGSDYENNLSSNDPQTNEVINAVEVLMSHKVNKINSQEKLMFFIIELLEALEEKLGIRYVCPYLPQIQKWKRKFLQESDVESDDYDADDDNTGELYAGGSYSNFMKQMSSLRKMKSNSKPHSGRSSVVATNGFVHCNITNRIRKKLLLSGKQTVSNFTKDYELPRDIILNILCHLSSSSHFNQKDLIRASLVNKTWNHIINNFVWEMKVISVINNLNKKDKDKDKDMIDNTHESMGSCLDSFSIDSSKVETVRENYINWINEDTKKMKIKIHWGFVFWQLQKIEENREIRARLMDLFNHLFDSGV